ncbi:MAG: dihydrodipicolinate synthase family protein [Bacteroidales bacterium]|nr:dihydrodipicolinate synthase family protein [Bacteroidales bacterium]
MEKIKGIIPPVITPLLDNEHIDYEGAARLLDRMIEGGVSALFLLGTTGESQSIAMHLRFEFVEFAAKHIAGRVPLLVAITETSMEDSLAMAAHAKKCGAVAVVSAPPYYFPGNQQELIGWYKTLADACPLPIFLYNMPSKVKSFLEVPTVVELSKHPNIIGLKDSSANLDYFREILKIFAGSDFACYMGPEELTGEMVMLGADGGVNGGANLYPEIFVEMYRAAASGDRSVFDAVQKRVMYLSDNLYHLDPTSDASFLRGVKTALEVKGICSGYVAWPYREYEGALRKKVESIVFDLDARGYR